MAKKLTSSKAKEILHDKSVHGQPLTDKQRRFFGAIAGGAKPYSAESGGWLDKYDAPKAQNGIEGTMGGLTDIGFNYNGAWGGTMQDGGSLWKTNKTQWVDSIHNANMDKNFVQRYFDPKYGSIPTPKDAPGYRPGQRSTHLMEYDPGSKRVYPSVVNKKGKLSYIPSGDDAWNYADSTGEYIQFPTVEQAKWYSSNGYKTGTNVIIGKKQMGGSLPGAVGFTYARTAGAAPANGPYAKKTKASAQNGASIPVIEDVGDFKDGIWVPNWKAMASEAKKIGAKKVRTKSGSIIYFNDNWEVVGADDNPTAQDGAMMRYYQEGLDFKPKTISQDGTVIDPMGYWNPENVGEPVIIPSTYITMEGVDQPLIGISDTGDVQYMQPGEDYSFDGEYVTEYPVAQKGTKVPAATTADSLALFNNAQKIVDYYKSKNYRTNRIDYGENSYVLGYLDDARKEFLKHTFVTVPTTSKKQKFVAPKDIENLYYKDVDKNKFYQRETANAILDTRSPMPLYDRRITPTLYMSLNNVNENDPLYLDGVSIFGYDPIAVKPYAMLTPEEKKLREQRYGKPKKETPKSSIKPEVKKEQPIEKIEQLKPIVEKKQNVYEGTPVYSPGAGSGLGSALIGFRGPKGDTTYIKPEDYERFAVPKYGKEYIEKKKMKNGGVSVNMADQYPIEKLDQSLNFTNYNKPTKGGWLDKWAD